MSTSLYMLMLMYTRIYLTIYVDTAIKNEYV